MDDITPQVQEMIMQGYTMKEIAENLSESRERINKIRCLFVQELEHENRPEETKLTKKQTARIHDIVYDVIKRASLDRSTRDSLRDQIIKELTAETRQSKNMTI